MFKWGRTLIVLVTVIIIILLIFNYRYPFISPGSKGWSIGYRTINNLIFQESYEDIST